MCTDNFRDVSAKTVVRTGFIPRWLVCGPFPMGDESEAYRLYRMGRLDVPDSDPIGGELLIEPVPGMVQRSDLIPEREAIWSVINATSPHISFQFMFSPTSHGIAYAASYLTTPTDQLLVCEFHPEMVGRLIVNHQVASPDSGFVQIFLKAGRNLILAKVLGGRGREALCGATLSFRQAKMVGRTGLAMTPPRATRFFRGTAEKPEMEVDFVLANTSDLDVFDVAVRISSDELDSEISRSIEVVRAGETKRVLHGLPVPRDGFDKARLKLEVVSGSTKASVSGQVTDIKPPERDATIYLGTGFHCDPIWTNTQSMYNDVSLHNVTQYLNFCRADPEFKVILHELDYLKPYFDFYPEDRDYLIGLVHEGRVILGGSYNQPNEKNVSGEQLVRNILYGKLFASSQFGADPKVYMGWDIFGRVVQTSQILAKSGFVGTVWEKTVKGFPPIFRHMSLDGTTLLHRRVKYDFNTDNLDHFRERAYSGLKEMESLGHGVDLRMDCNDFKSPTAWMLGRAGEMKTLLPRVEVADPARFFEDVIKEESSGLPVPVTSRDPNQHHMGTSQSRIELKIANRLGETALYNAELLSTLACLFGGAYPDLALDKAWRQILFNSHHDAITGTSNDKSYLDMLQGYREALGLANHVVVSSLDFLAKKIDTEDAEGIALLVFNSLNWNRTDVARADITFKKPVSSFSLFDTSGKKVSFSVLEKEKDEKGITSARIEFIAREIPSVGYATYHIKPSDGGNPPTWAVKEGAMDIENEFFKITIDPSRGGGISSILDKKTGKELVPPEADHLANEIAVLKEKNDRNEPSWELYTTGERMFSRDFPVKISVRRSGPTSKFEIKGRLGETCELVREIWLRKGIRRVDFRTEIRGYEKQDDLFVALFPVDVQGGAPTYEERFGAIVKHPGRRFLDYRTWRSDVFSDCMIHPSQNFFDFGSTTKIRFVDFRSKTVASCPLGSVGLVLPHSKEAQIISRDLQKALANRGVLTTPWFDDDDSPRRAQLSHQDSTEAPSKNMDLTSCNFRISIGQTGNNSYSLSVLEAIDEPVANKFRDRIAKLGFDFVVTLDRDVPEGWKPIPVLVIEARNSEYLEKAIDFLVDGLRSGDMILPQHANLLGRASVDDYGLSILNRGNMASTVEPDGTMTLFLKHTSNWSRVHLEEEFIPERKEHVFFYSLYPHSRSWREARSYRRGREYNIPLICAQTEHHRGVLPGSHSFLGISEDNVVLSAIKPAGNPVAAFKSSSSDSSKAFIVRIYDAEGKRSEAKFGFSFPVESAWKTDLLENRESPIMVEEGHFSQEIGPFSIETFEVKPSLQAEEMKEEIASRPREKVQPIYSKYWKENLGPAPIGYQPVTLSIHGSPITEAGGRGTTVNRISISIVNNYVDRVISGDAVIEAPSGWRVEPEKIWYEIPPQGHESYDVAFSFSGLRRCGLLRVRLCHEGQVFEDVIEIGEQSRLAYTGGGSVYQDVLKAQIERSVTWSVFPREDGVSVLVENPYNERVDGGVALITPLETWSKAEVGDYSLVEMGPPVQAFHIPPKSFQVLEFKFAEKDPHFWIYAKLYYMGRTEYRRVR